MMQIALIDKNNPFRIPPHPPLEKGGKGGFKGGLKGITDKRGFSQVELMISLVLLLFVFLALAQTALVSIDSNMTNILRDEAVSVAEMRMNEARALPFTQTVDSLVGDGSDSSLTATICPANFVTNFGTTGLRVPKNFRNINFNFCTNRTATMLNANNKQVTITVGWKWKGEDKTHTITTIVRKS